jgi:hypothetical protein
MISLFCFLVVSVLCNYFINNAIILCVLHTLTICLIVVHQCFLQLCQTFLVIYVSHDF